MQKLTNSERYSAWNNVLLHSSMLGLPLLTKLTAQTDIKQMAGLAFVQ